MSGIDKTIAHIKWCEAYIEEYKKNAEFDPYAMLTDTETKEQQLFGLCIDYIYGIEDSLTKASEAFKAARNSIVFSCERSETA